MKRLAQVLAWWLACYLAGTLVRELIYLDRHAKQDRALIVDLQANQTRELTLIKFLERRP